VNSQPKLRPCKNFTACGVHTGLQDCSNPSCKFAHIVKCHKSYAGSTKIEALSNRGGYNNQQLQAPVAGLATWMQTPTSAPQIFSGSHDGFWRLWDSSNNFSKSFENACGIKVTHLLVDSVSQKLVVAFESAFNGTSGLIVNPKDTAQTGAGAVSKEEKANLHTVGLIQSWDLNQPQAPPTNYHLSQFAPYASHKPITCLLTIPDAANPTHPIVIASGEEPAIRVWKMNPTATPQPAYAPVSTMFGHVRPVTTMLTLDGLLWSGSIDGNLRIWDPTAGECKHVVLAGKSATGGGHTGPITDSIVVEAEGSKFVVTASLDATVRAWDMSANLMKDEAMGQGVVCLNSIDDTGGNKLLLCGLEKGNVMIRHFPSFMNLMVLSSQYSCGHDGGAVRCIEIGPNNCFFTGGEDGKVMVWQIVGDAAKMMT